MVKPAKGWARGIQGTPALRRRHGGGPAAQRRHVRDRYSRGHPRALGSAGGFSTRRGDPPYCTADGSTWAPPMRTEISSRKLQHESGCSSVCPGLSPCAGASVPCCPGGCTGLFRGLEGRGFRRTAITGDSAGGDLALVLASRVTAKDFPAKGNPRRGCCDLPGHRPVSLG